jgi:hypothetical protein
MREEGLEGPREDADLLEGGLVEALVHARHADEDGRPERLDVVLQLLDVASEVACGRRLGPGHEGSCGGGRRGDRACAPMEAPKLRSAISTFISKMCASGRYDR